MAELSESRFFRGYHRGMLYFAQIMESMYPGEWNLTCYTRDDHGHQCVEVSKIYKTIPAAINAMKRKYPETKWEEY